MTAEALSQSAAPSEADYDRFCATVMATARGRWFLAEYARRHRKADTSSVLDALHKIEDMVRAKPEPALARLRDEVRALAAIVREAKRDLAASGGVMSDATKVMALLDLLSERIEESLSPGDDRTPLPVPDAAAPHPHLTIIQARAASALPPIEFDAKPPQPPKVAPLPPAALAHVIPLPQVKQPEPAPLPAVSLGADEHYVPFAFEPLPQELPDPPRPAVRPNVFADVMALTEAERIALFS